MKNEKEKKFVGNHVDEIGGIGVCPPKQTTNHMHIINV